MFYFYNTFADSTTFDIFDISNLVIALINVVLLFYIFVYQRNHDKKNDSSTARLYQQNVRLQWFKELIIQPNLKDIYGFFKEIEKNSFPIGRKVLSPSVQKQINEYNNERLRHFRKQFISLLARIDRELYTKVLYNVDELIDSITEEIYVKNPSQIHFSSEISFVDSKILESKNKLLFDLWSYEGNCTVTSSI